MLSSNRDCAKSRGRKPSGCVSFVPRRRAWHEPCSVMKDQRAPLLRAALTAIDQPAARKTCGFGRWCATGRAESSGRLLQSTRQSGSFFHLSVGVGLARRLGPVTEGLDAPARLLRVFRFATSANLARCAWQPRGRTRGTRNRRSRKVHGGASNFLIAPQSRRSVAQRRAGLASNSFSEIAVTKQEPPSWPKETASDSEVVKCDDSKTSW